jgi:hypothetical protein
MNLKYKHISSDGHLTLLVYQNSDDWIIGFDGFEWHIHGNLLMPEYGDSPAIAAKNFMKAILEDREFIAISEFIDKPSIISIIDDPESERKYKLPEETLTIRTWSGKQKISR